MGYVIAILALVILAVLLFHPKLQGFRTLILGWLTAIGGFLLPLITQLTEYLQTLDWRQYVLNFSDRKNLMVIAIPGVIGVLIIILRYLTKGPVGQKP